eukprot:gene12386-biopygen14014
MFFQPWPRRTRTVPGWLWDGLDRRPSSVRNAHTEHRHALTSLRPRTSSAAADPLALAACNAQSGRRPSFLRRQGKKLVLCRGYAGGVLGERTLHK